MPSRRFDPVWAIGKPIAYAILRWFRWQCVGTEHIARDGPVILASNHISFADEAALMWLTNLRRRKPRFMAKADLWNVPVLRFFLRYEHQIPVDRSSPLAAGSFVSAVRMLKSGELVCLFPEGAISRDLEPAAAKTGVARLAASTGVPVTPVGLWGPQRVFPLGRKRYFRVGACMTMVVGEPIAVAEDDDPVEATDRIMGAIVDCVRTARAIYPQRPRRREDPWWVRGPESAVLQPTRRQVSSPAPGA